MTTWGKCFCRVWLTFTAGCLAPVNDRLVIECGTGTVEVDGRCISSLTCGPGTVERNGRCEASGGAGGGVAGGLTCGTGTTELNGACVSTGKECGTGTHAEGALCVRDLVTSPCGAGTHEAMGSCVPDVRCGPGTQAMNGQCVPTTGLTCGIGTSEVSGSCVSTLSCGSGTVLMSGQCVASTGAWYDVRVATLSVPADGYSHVPVLAIGRQANGQPALDPVVLTLTRSSAGTLTPSQVTLTGIGAFTHLQPCSTATTGCLGPARVVMALASSPNVPVATSEEFMLVAPPGVGTPANCLAYPQALYFSGSGYIFTGTQLITAGTFTSTGAYGRPNEAGFRVTASNATMGYWSIELAAPQGSTLVAQPYHGATRWPFQPPTAPGLSVSGSGRGCNQSTGAFEIQTITHGLPDGGLSELVMTFEQFCENQPSNVLRGCMRYTP